MNRQKIETILSRRARSYLYGFIRFEGDLLEIDCFTPPPLVKRLPKPEGAEAMNQRQTRTDLSTLYNYIHCFEVRFHDLVFYIDKNDLQRRIEDGFREALTDIAALIPPPPAPQDVAPRPIITRENVDEILLKIHILVELISELAEIEEGEETRLILLEIAAGLTPTRKS